MTFERGSKQIASKLYNCYKYTNLNKVHVSLPFIKREMPAEKEKKEFVLKFKGHEQIVNSKFRDFF